ncbi:calcium-binding protein [Bauldia sp.]|uniref:calcium-binding protein n=1 Tax=Bauldia sp. TaxID=2575872 RepID=UPI003BABD36B
MPTEEPPPPEDHEHSDDPGPGNSHDETNEDDASQEEAADEGTLPLVIDLGPTGSEVQEDGLVFLDRHMSPVFYDFDGDGYAERTAWVGPDEGIVVWDKTGNITVDDEGFMNGGGVSTGEIVLTKGVDGATDLDVLLKKFDDNDNGVLDEDELNGSAGGNGGKLYIWQDKNLDGEVQHEEVQRLTNIVKEIDATAVDYLDPDALVDADGDGQRDDAEPAVRLRDGSMIFGTAAVTLQNGSNTTAYDMSFAYNDLGIKRNDETNTISFEGGGKQWDGDSGDDVKVAGTEEPWQMLGRGGDDKLTGGDFDDMLDGGVGADELKGGRGDDILIVDSDDTLIKGQLGYDIVLVERDGGVTLDMVKAEVEAFYGGVGDDVVTAEYDGSVHGNVERPTFGAYINGGDGNDSLTGGKKSDYIIGGDGDDTLRGKDGHDYIHGGAGADSIRGNDGNDIIVADLADDIGSDASNLGDVLGGDGFDLLIIASGADDPVPTGTRILKLADLGFEGGVGTQGDDEIYAETFVDDEGHKIGTILAGLGGNDLLDAAGGDDIIDGGQGDDELVGRKGSDIYLFQRGDGIDTIVESNETDGGRDVIVFGSDITPEDLQFERDGNDFIITIPGENGGDPDNKITIVDWKVSGNYDDSRFVELLTFSNGTILDIHNAKIHVFGNPDNNNSVVLDDIGLDRAWIADGGKGADTITGAKGNDIIFGNNGHDTLKGAEGHDYVSGGGGDDTIQGHADNDMLLGGIGNDKLYGGAGDDVLDGGKNADILEGGGGDDVLAGGSGHDTLKGEDGNDVLAGGGGDDTLKGGDGKDVYVIGRDQGKDDIIDSGGDDTLVFGHGISISDLSFDMSGGALRIGIGRQGDIAKPSQTDNRVNIQNWENESDRIETFVFTNGLVMDVRDVSKGTTGDHDGGSNSTILVGGDGGDSIGAGAGDDVLIGGSGNDGLRGNQGNDSIFGGNGNDGNLNGGPGNDRIFGGNGNDELWGEDGNDFLAGGAGDDVMNGHTGSDTFFFSWGDGFGNKIKEDVGKLGYDQILFGSGIWLTDISVTRSNDSLYIKLFTPDGQAQSTKIEITEIGDAGPNNAGPIEYLSLSSGFSMEFSWILNGEQGTDGNDTLDAHDPDGGDHKGHWLYGRDGDDRLTGDNADDVLIGGRNDDYMFGKGGNDTYAFDYGDGRDRIKENDGGEDKIALGFGIDHSDLAIDTVDGHVVIMILENQDQQNLATDRHNFDDYILIENYYEDVEDGGNRKIEELVFADGSTINIDGIKGYTFGSGNADETLGDRDNWVTAGGGDDTISAGGGNDRVYAGKGHDDISGNSGADWLEGQDGDDKLRGGDGGDTLIGGIGNDDLGGGEWRDALYGGEGDDTIHSDDDNEADLIVGGRGDDIIYRGGKSEDPGDALFFNDDGVGYHLPGHDPGGLFGSWIVFNAGDGHDTIYKGVGTGEHDVIEINGYSHEQIWFDRAGDDLKIKFLGSEDKMVFKDYFTNTNHKFEAIIAGDHFLRRSEIGDLITKMNGHVPNDGTNGDGVTASALPSGVENQIKDAWEAWPKTPEYVPVVGVVPAEDWDPRDALPPAIRYGLEAEWGINSDPDMLVYS